MEYEVLARKWRPQQFDQVVGQDHVTQTLANAITTDRLAHAYLFVAERGRKGPIPGLFVLNADGSLRATLGLAASEASDVVKLLRANRVWF